MSNKQTIIILEGHDCSGKTTIAKELSKKLNIFIHKRHIDKNRWFDPNIDLVYGVDSIVDFIEDTKVSVIIDRFYPSEFVYAKTFNRSLCENKVFEIDVRMSKLNALIVHCFKNVDSRKEDEHGIIKLNQYEDLLSNYRRFFMQTKCHWLDLNTTDENIFNQYLKISNKLKEIHYG